MPIDLLRPDLAMSLTLDPYAPRAARYHVAQVDRPSPDLRDAVMLLTSELVTRAVQQSHSSDATIDLRAWMPADVVRVELRAPREHLGLPPDGDAHDYSTLLLEELADRWALDDTGEDACMWFEIDRHAHDGAEASAQPPGGS
jgi:hypothetical protein